MRTDAGEIVGVVEEADASDEQKTIQEANMGVYCFRADPLRTALPKLLPANTQSEFYLTDIVELFARKKLTISSVVAADPAEVAGVNDAAQLAACEKMASRYFN